jgi:DNA polymerase
MISDRDKIARELLAFYLEAGVDTVIGETAVDRFADEAPIAPAATATAAPTAEVARSTMALPTLQPRGGNGTAPEGRVIQAHELDAQGRLASAPQAPDTAVMAAREAARSAATLDDLRAILSGFDGCALKATAKQLVFSDGNPQARLMFVGEAPGREEDIEGLPFVGRSGKLLDLMLAAIGLDRTSVYIANIVPWRPPGNRTPTPQETAICLPFVARQIELANPDVLVCLGNPSTQTLLSTKEGITRTRGRWFKFQTGTREIRAMPTLHPAYLLRQPLSKRLAWRDFLAIKKALAN